MSGSPDDRFDTPRALDPRELAAARSAAQIPGVLLIVTGVLSLIGSVIGLIQLPQMPAQMDQAMAQIEADPNIPAEQKAAWKDAITTMKQVAEHPGAIAGYVLGIVASLVVVLGGIKLMNLSGSTLPMIGSVFAMIPCTVGCCCVLGVPAGIWALVVVNRSDVRAAIAARRSLPPHDPDAQYMR